MQRFFSFFVGVMVGGLVGATVAVLLAPMSGKELQSQIQERSTQMMSDIKSVAEARRAELERELAALRAPAKSE
jgi:gas vesicle protein